MAARRFVLFLVVVLSMWAALHAYVFARAASVPFVAARFTPAALAALALVLGASYPLARVAESRGALRSAALLELFGATWMGVLFLAFSALLAADVLTGFGFLMPGRAPAIRGWSLAAALALSLVAIVQGLRPPAVTSYEVPLRDLHAGRDGTTVVLVSDLHLGALLGARWLEARVRQVEALKPDLVVACGDIIDSDVRAVLPLVPILKRLRGRLGAYAVTGNHEYYAGVDRSVRVFEEAGFRVLRDEWAQAAPGLILAGVDDLTTRAQMGVSSDAIGHALSGRPPGAAILLSHTPWQAERAARGGAGLMLSGHTHAGQIWPFSVLVRLRYRLLSGRYDVDGMPVIVCRGTGTWGPRMRLFRRGEITRITLRSPALPEV